MENKYIKKLVKCYSTLAVKVLPEHLHFFDLNSGQVIRTLDRCLRLLNNGADYIDLPISNKRIADYCIHNVNRLSLMPDNILDVFKYNQVFGEASVKKFIESPSGARYYEDLLLEKIKMNRRSVELLISEQDHPHKQFINTKYENKVKRRKHNTKVGYYLCQKSTLGWNPHSKECTTCIWEQKCKEATKSKYPELYRLRVESVNR